MLGDSPNLSDSMIPKNTSRRKKPKKNTNLNTTMGILLSKPKEKQQKREGLMAQMKNKTEDVSPSKKTPARGSPSPPPRRLSSTLESASLTTEFLSFLRDLDTASLVPHNECGRAEALQFVIEVRQLINTKEDESKVSLLQEMGRRYFSQSEDGRRLVLENSELWRRISEQCAKCDDVSSAQENVSRAHDSLMSELDENHLLFLQTRRQTSCVDKVMCLL